MFIADYPVTKFYWEPLFKRIERCFRLKLYEHVDGDVYLMWKRGCRIYVAAKQNKNGCFDVYGWYYLYQQKGWEAWEIYQSYIFKEHQGQGWSSAIIDAIILKEKLTLASGPQQTWKARALWKRMIAKSKFTIWAHDFKNLDSWAPVEYDPENDELWCSLPVYDRHITPMTKKRDIRFIAIRKSNDHRIRRTTQSA